MFDYVIIGGGPTGLTIAYYLGKYEKKILLIERESNIGGCHRVRRINGLFTEHGPRIYLSSSKNLQFLLQNMNSSFDEHFTKYNFGKNDIFPDLTKYLSFNEYKSFVSEYFKLIYGNQNYSKHVTMDTFMSKNHFSDKAKQYVYSMCKLTEGADPTRYTLYEFLQLLNLTFFYSLYQLKYPTDKGLMKLWYDKLVEMKNITILLNHEVLSIDDSLTISDLRGDKIVKVKANNYILALPPELTLNILEKSPLHIKNSFGDFNLLREWEIQSRYDVYVTIVFHWNKKLKLNKIWGKPIKEWGIIHIVLSDYTDFDNSDSQTVISASISNLNNKSGFTGKTANESDEQELILETFRQLKYLYPSLSDPTFSILSPGIYKSNNQWKTKDSAFVLSKYGYFDKQTSNIKGLYWAGLHNGKSDFDFSSIESAIGNGLSLVHKLVPESKIMYSLRKPITFIFFIRFIIIILIIVIISKISKYQT